MVAPAGAGCNRSEVLIRRASIQDANAIARINVLAWQAAYAGQLPADFLADLSVEERRHQWSERISNAEGAAAIWVAVDETKVVGFASCGPSPDDNADCGALYAIYLDPRRRREGIGRSLHDRSMEQLRQAGYDEATLWVLSTNVPARRFYEALGWLPDGVTQLDKIGGASVQETRYRKVLDVPFPCQ